MRLTMSPVLVLADISMSAVKRETQSLQANVCCPRNGNQASSIDDRSSLKPLCSLHGKVRRSCLLARIPARTGGNAANGDVRDAIRAWSGYFRLLSFRSLILFRYFFSIQPAGKWAGYLYLEK